MKADLKALELRSPLSVTFSERCSGVKTMDLVTQFYITNIGMNITLLHTGILNQVLNQVLDF